jgi:hypothetical protein
MPVTIKVDGLFNSVAHKGSNGISMATIPDVCKTPTPGGPVPMPYPNIAQAAMLAKGTTTVKTDGMMASIKGSEFSISNGDEPGVAGGVVSSTFIKEASWLLYCFTVKMDGQCVCRFTDPMFHNHQNTVNMSGVVVAPVALMVNIDLVGKDQEEACKKYNEKRVTDDDKACEKSGMRRDDYDDMKSYSEHKDAAISIRKTNPDTTKYIGQGQYESKPSWVQKGTGKSDIPGLTEPVGGPPPRRFCGDYDMHEMISNNSRTGGPGTPITGAAQDRTISEMNRVMNPSGDVMKDRVKHGPASDLGAYLHDHPDKAIGADGERRKQYLNPTVSKDDPLTVFDDGKVHQLDSPEDVMNMYKCKGMDLPEQWNLKDQHGNALDRKGNPIKS